MKKIVIIAFLFTCLMLSACQDEKYDVKFFIDNELYEEINLRNISDIELPEVNLEEGIEFSGWHFDIDCNIEFNIESILNYVSKYNLNIYGKTDDLRDKKIVFNVDNTFYDEVLYTEFELPTEPTFNNYTFIGWYYGDDLFDESNLETYFNNTKEIVLEAKFQENKKLEIIFVTNEETSYKFHLDEFDMIDEPNIERFTFDGWYIDSEYDTLFDITNLEQYFSEDDTIYVYAKLVEDEKVKIFVNDENGELYTFEIYKGEYITDIKVIEFDDKNFVGWYYKNYNTIYNFRIPITSDITIYAKYADIADVTYDIVNGEIEITGGVLSGN